MKNNAICANVLDVMTESYEVNYDGVQLNSCVIVDRNTGKFYITGEEGRITNESGYCFEAMECKCDCFGKCMELVTPLNIVYIAPIFTYGKLLGYVFGDKMINYKDR